MRATTAVGISPEIKVELTEAAKKLRLTTKETVLMGVKAIALLTPEQRQALADEVHRMQVNREI
jgi:hypothetical protein